MSEHVSGVPATLPPRDQPRRVSAGLERALEGGGASLVLGLRNYPH